MSIFIFMVTIWILPKIYWRLRRSPAEVTTSYPKWSTTTPTLLFIWWFTWVSSFGIFVAFVRNVRDMLTEKGVTPLEHLVQEPSTLKYGYYVYDLIDGFFRVYGSTLLYIIIALIAFPIISRKLSARADLNNLYSLYGPLAAFALGTMVLYVAQSTFGPTRGFAYIIIICTFFVGFILHEMVGKAQSSSQGHGFSKPILVAVVFILCLVSVAGIYKVYPSPYVYALSQQIAQNEVKGMDFVYQHRDINIRMLDYYSVGIRSFQYLLEGENEGRSGGDTQLKWEANIPYHFDYESYPYLGALYSEDKYMIVNNRFRLQYVEVYPVMAEQRFLPSDFEKLEHDFSLDKVYTNGELDVWRVHGMATPISTP